MEPFISHQIIISDIMLCGHVVFLTFFSFMYISACMNTDFYIDFNSFCNGEIHKNAFSVRLFRSAFNAALKGRVTPIEGKK